MWKLGSHDERSDSLDVRFDRFAVDFGTVRVDHEARISRLERFRAE